jgi:hypothetical protein
MLVEENWVLEVAAACTVRCLRPHFVCEPNDEPAGLGPGLDFKSMKLVGGA